MYLIDFFKRVTRKSNIPTFIYLVLNVFVIGAVISLLFSLKLWQATLIGLGLYLISLVIALSPIGEWMLRKQTGCRKLRSPEEICYLQPLFEEVYAQAKQLEPGIPDDVQLYINNDEDANAFATGRKTICVTKGLLNLPAEQIKATLGHEFGHLAHKDTDLILVVYVGNLIVNLLIFTIRLIISFIHIVGSISAVLLGGSDGIYASIVNGLVHILASVCVSGLVWVWTQVGTLLVMKTSRGNEYEADAFSWSLGYGSELCAALDTICGGNTSGLFASLVASHPDKCDRIARLQSMGAAYQA